MKYKLLTLSILLLHIAARAQQDNMVAKRCHTMEHLEYLKSKDPGLEKRMAEDKARLKEFSGNLRVQNDPSLVITIPVVVHIVYNTTDQRIPISQVMSQIEVLNDDFGRTNSDSALTPAIFKGRASNTGIRFCLAQRTPSGASTNGIDYVTTNVTQFGTDDNIKKTASGGVDAWDVTKYFNIWVGNLSGGLLGYSEFPTSQPSSTYGVVIHYRAFGKSGNLMPAYNKGRTATHEIGHCFNMTHIWGDEANCSQDDDISDTPQQKDSNFGCPTFPQDETKAGGCCNASDVSSMYMNYMDYTNDNCMNLWTHDQGTAMTNALQFFKASLISSTACNASVGINDPDDAIRFSLSPNPVSDIVTIKLDGNHLSNVNFRVYSMLGDLLPVKAISVHSDQYKLDLSGLPEGVYFLEARSGSSTEGRRIVITR